MQILYQGTAASFAWILPTPSLPELSVGTDLLFERLDGATAPRFSTESRTSGSCRSRPRCYVPPDRGYGGSVDGSAAWADASARDAGGAEPPTVDVHLRAAVGPYDAAVISSDDATALRTWLADNGYDIPEASLPLIAYYVDKRDFFVALKLLTDRTAGEIQPIVLRYVERQPCIPIRLTAIAAVPDMPITAWVLGDGRAHPYNYLDLVPPVNDARLYLGGISYRSLVSRAVDDAGGRAFVTDYAGSVPSIGVTITPVDDLREETDPGVFVRALTSRGYAGDTQLLGILLRHLPPPSGTTAQRFYNCLASEWCGEHDEYLATLPFDPAALAEDLTAAIVTPRAEAQAMLERHPKLTRLFTTMSPEDMIDDPVFVLRESSSIVSHLHVATLVTECGPEYFVDTAPQSLVLPSGDVHPVRSGTPYTGSDDDYCRERTGYGVDGPGADRPLSASFAGSSCAAAPAAGGAAATALVCAALLLLFRRRGGRRG